jgi:hypothetical protein
MPTTKTTKSARQQRQREPQKRTGELPALGVVSRVDALDASAKRAWWHDLAAWVHTLRTDYAHLWPDEGAERGSAALSAGLRPANMRRGWPACWYRHRGLVEDLVALRAWQDGLLAGAEWAGGPRGWLDWALFLQNTAAREVEAVSQLCRVRHVEMARFHAADHLAEVEALDAWLVDPEGKAAAPVRAIRPQSGH